MNIAKIFFLLSLRIVECYLKEINENYARNLTNKVLQPDTNTYGAHESLLNYIEANQLKGILVAAYVGAAATIPCAPRMSLYVNNPVWYFTECINNMTLSIMEKKDMGVENGDLTIFYVRLADAGVYQCQVGCIFGDLVVLDVLDDEDKYNVVKPNSTWGPYASPKTALTARLTLFTTWSTWSTCSRCGAVGRRRRYGIRYIGQGTAQDITERYVAISDEKPLHSNYMAQLLQAFPEGVFYQSKLLPQPVRDLVGATAMKNEIMIGLCKVPCTTDMFEMRAADGELLEQANNSAGAYSLSQREPPRPPPIARRIVFAPRGTTVVIRCPGTTLRDMPVSWRRGAGEVAPLCVERGSGGRAHLNARDHLVVGGVLPADAGVYSCWQRQDLAGVVKLKVYEDSHDKYGRRLLLIGLFLCLCATLTLTENVYSCQRRRYVRL